MDTLNFDFRKWICEHENSEYQINQENEDSILLVTDYATANIRFTSIEQGTIVEFEIVSKKDDSTKFYLHFELNDQNHAKQLYDEMVESLLKLKNEQTIRILLSCTAGLTTSMFAESLNTAAQTLNVDYHFEAVPYLNIYEQASNYDVILIAPQIGYMLDKIKDIIHDRPVLQIPTSAFASYDALAVINFLQEEIETFHKSESAASHENRCGEYEKRILSIVLIRNSVQTRLRYCVYDKGQVTASKIIIKPSFSLKDIYDIIDTVLLRYKKMDAIGIASPGIVKDKDRKQIFQPSSSTVDLKTVFEDKYHIETFAYNNASAAAVGFSLAHPEFKNIVYHSQPFGFPVGGQGIIVDGKIVNGKNGISGEIGHYVRRLQFSDEIAKLIWTDQGAIEVVSKALLPTIIAIGPEAVAISSAMTPNVEEVKKALSSFISEEFLPEFFFIREPTSYMLSGITKLCLDYLNDKAEEEK